MKPQVSFSLALFLQNHPYVMCSTQLQLHPDDASFSSLLYTLYSFFDRDNGYLSMKFQSLFSAESYAHVQGVHVQGVV